MEVLDIHHKQSYNKQNESGKVCCTRMPNNETLGMNGMAKPPCILSGHLVCSVYRMQSQALWNCRVCGSVDTVNPNLNHLMVCCRKFCGMVI